MAKDRPSVGQLWGGQSQGETELNHPSLNVVAQLCGRRCKVTNRPCPPECPNRARQVIAEIIADPHLQSTLAQGAFHEQRLHRGVIRSNEAMEQMDTGQLIGEMTRRQPYTSVAREAIGDMFDAQKRLAESLQEQEEKGSFDGSFCRQRNNN